jgi:ketopantoate reductase
MALAAHAPPGASARRVHVLGAGAMGSLWASSLALAGHQVRLLVRDPARHDGQMSILLERRFITDDQSQQYSTCQVQVGSIMSLPANSI